MGKKALLESAKLPPGICIENLGVFGQLLHIAKRLFSLPYPAFARNVQFFRVRSGVEAIKLYLVAGVI